MKSYFPQFFPRFFSASLLLLLTTPLCMAQVPVVDAAGSSDQSPSTRAGQNDNSELLLTLYNQIDQLQREVANLRGMVEEQSFQIRRMQTEQRDRYLDVDQRLTELSTGAQGLAAGTSPVNANPTTSGPSTSPGAGNQPQALPASPGINRPANTVGTGPGTAVTRPAMNTGLPAANQSQAGASVDQGTADPAPTAQNEEQIYTSALDLLLSESRIEESIAAFGRYIDAYPEGQFLANAFYWQGEALILVERFAQAESVFRKVIDDYPMHAKAPDSLLKLGMVYERSGNDERAREAWETISTRYPQSTNIIRLAEDNLSRL